MKVHPFSNGKSRGLGKFLSLVDFFFPYAKRKNGDEYMRQEMGSSSDGECHFYTFRSLAVHYWNTRVVQKLKKLASIELRVPVLELVPGMKMPVGFHFVIATDATSDSTGASASSRTWNHTVTGSNTLLIVSAWNNSLAAARTFPGPNTYNGVSLTELTNTNISGAGGYSDVLYLVGPATGTNSTVITQSASGFMGCFGDSYSGVTQSSPIYGTQVDSTQTGASGTISVNATTANSWVVAMTEDNVNGAPAAGSGTTLRIANSSTQNGGLYDSNAAVSGNYSLNFTGTGTSKYAIIAFAIAPATAASTAKTATTLLMGV